MGTGGVGVGGVGGEGGKGGAGRIGEGASGGMILHFPIFGIEISKQINLGPLHSNEVHALNGLLLGQTLCMHLRKKNRGV